MAVGKLIYDILGIYSGIIIASAIMSWLVAFGVINVRNQVIRVIVDLLYRVTEPVLRPIRRILPNMGPVDLSPLVVFILIWFARNLLAEYWPVLMGTSSRPSTD